MLDYVPILPKPSYENTPVFKKGSSNKTKVNVSPPKENYPRPPYSYTCMIYLAMKNNPGSNMSVVDIYDFIKEHFPYFKYTTNSLWKNAVRHSLSQYKAFVKVDKPYPTTPAKRIRTDWALTTNGSSIQKLETEIIKLARRESEKIKSSLKNPDIFIDLLEGKVQPTTNTRTDQQNFNVFIPDFECTISFSFHKSNIPISKPKICSIYAKIYIDILKVFLKPS